MACSTRGFSFSKIENFSDFALNRIFRCVAGVSPSAFVERIVRTMFLGVKYSRVAGVSPSAFVERYLRARQFDLIRRVAGVSPSAFVER